MSLGVFYSAQSNTDFPFIDSSLRSTQLRQMFFDLETHSIIGVFFRENVNWNIFTGPPNRYTYFTVARIWRNGKLIDGSSSFFNFPSQGRMVLDSTVVKNPKFAQVLNGRVIRSPNTGKLFSDISTLYDPPEAYYQVDPLCPLLTIQNRVTDASNFSTVHIGCMINGNPDRIFIIGDLGSSTSIVEKPANITRFISPSSESWRYPREIHPIGINKIAVSYYPSLPDEINNSPIPPGNAMLLRVFDISVDPFQVILEAELPADDEYYDDVFCYDVQNNIIYSANRFFPRLHASILKRSPVSISVPTIVGSSTSLRALTPTFISVIVKDSLNSVISNEVVRWSLGSTLSGGYLHSAYSLTNQSGVATITYVGPYSPSNGMTETVLAEVGSV